MSSTSDLAVHPPTPKSVPHDLSHTVQGLSCPNCGGALEVDTGLRVLVCPYCGTHLLATSELQARRFAVEPKIDSAQAKAVAWKWLTTGFRKDPGLKKSAEIREALLSFLPFYRVEADCVGFALGTEERQRTVGTGKNRRRQRYEVDVERSAAKSFDRTYPAVNVAEWGIQKVHLEGDPIVAFDPAALDRLGMVFPTTGDEAQVRQAALAQFKSEADPSTGLKRTRFRFLESLRERLSVVYYPIWVVRYLYRGRSYQILVDAEDGALSYGKAAGNDLYRALMLVLSQALAAFIGTTALQYSSGSLVVLLFALGLGSAIFVWGWKRFRWGGVVVEGTGVKRERSLIEEAAENVHSPQTLLRKFSALQRRRR